MQISIFLDGKRLGLCHPKICSMLWRTSAQGTLSNQGLAGEPKDAVALKQD